MVLSAEDLGEAVRKLGELKRYMPNVPAYLNPVAEEVYGLGGHVASQLKGKREPLQAADYYMAALSHRRGSHLTPTGAEMLAVARVVFPDRFVREVETYMDQLDSAKAARRPPH